MRQIVYLPDGKMARAYITECPQIDGWLVKVLTSKKINIADCIKTGVGYLAVVDIDKDMLLCEVVNDRGCKTDRSETEATGAEHSQKDLQGSGYESDQTSSQRRAAER